MLPAISIRAPDKKNGGAKLKRYFPIGNDVAKRACKRIIKVIMFVLLRANKMYTGVNFSNFLKITY